MAIQGNNLRKKAEALLSKKGIQLINVSDDINKLFYDLQIHQIELELQNEELKQSQHRLVVSRDRYLKLFNSSPIGFITLSTAGVILNINPAASQLLSPDNKGLINKKFGHFINPLDQDSLHFFIQDVLTKSTVQPITIRLSRCAAAPIATDCQNLNFCKALPEVCVNSDQAIYIECRGTYCVDETANQQICLSIVDITAETTAHKTIACLNEKLEKKVVQQNLTLRETDQDLRKKIEQLALYRRQILDREAMLNAIFNAAMEGIMTMHLSGVIVYVNDTVESIFGYRKDELMNCNVHINKLFPMSTQKSSSQGFKNGLGINLLSKIGKIHEKTGVRKDGSTLPLDISIAQFSIEGVDYLTMIIRDITSRKLQETNAKKHLDELAHVTRLGLMGELASGIAHEVNQPLTAISSYSQVVLNLLAEENYDRELLNEIFTKINDQVFKAGQIIHRMRDFVKSKKIHRSTVDINAVIHDALGLCDAYVKHNNIHPRLQLMAQLPTLSVDSIQIEQVILNLITNSIDALKNASQLRPRQLSIQSTINDQNEIEIRVKDNGPGISLSEQKKIFTPFYTSKSEGMGMGLSICRSIIEAHNGTLRFNSQPGKGTTFYFTLPVEEKIHGS